VGNYIFFKFEPILIKTKKVETEIIIKRILNTINKYNGNYDKKRYLADSYLDTIFEIYNAERYHVDLLDSIMEEWEKQN
jgi:hypothetical protein